MRLNIWRRGGGLERGVLEGSTRGIFICALLWGSTALGMKVHDAHLDKRIPQPQPQGPQPPATVWVTVRAQGGWMVTEFTTTTVTPTAGRNFGSTSIATVTSTATTEVTVTNTVTVQSTTTKTSTQSTEAIVTGTTTPQPTGISTITTSQLPRTNGTTVTDVVVMGQAAVATITDFVAATTTAGLEGSWGQGAPVVRRQVEPVTLTTTIWDWNSGTTTSIVTATAAPTPPVNGFVVQTSMVMLTTTFVTTQTSTFTTEKTVTASSSAATSPTAIVIDQTDPSGVQSDTGSKAPNIEIILGASFGALVGFVAIFVLAYLWAKKRREGDLRQESVGFSNNGFLRSTPAAGTGVMGMIGSLRRGPSTRYNNLPTAESIPNMSPLPAPPHSPPPQLPSLRVLPPSGEFNYDYTFGSPVSSIDEAQLHALTSGGSINRMGTPPSEPPTAPDALFYTLSRQNEEPPWRTGAPVAETIATETVVSSVSSESERIGSLRRKPLPGGSLVSP